MAELFGFDAYSPKEIAERVENIGVTKARLPLLTVATLGVLAGGFVGLGALYFTLVTSDTSLGFAASRLLGGVTFSLGLILVVVAGAELFTGNNLLVMAWASRRITTKELITNWTIVYLANLAGALGLVFLVVLSHNWQMNSNAVGINAVKIAAAKTALPFWEAFFKGIVCNILVCLAVWLALAGRSVTDKIVAVIFSHICVRCSRLRAQRRQHVLHTIGLNTKGSNSGWSRRKSFLGRTLVQSHARDSGQHCGRQRYGGAGLLFRLPPPGQRLNRNILNLNSVRHELHSKGSSLLPSSFYFFFSPVRNPGSFCALMKMN
jgi:formate transporter